MEPVRLFFGSSCPGNTFFVGNTDPLFREINSGMNMEQASKRRPFFSSPEELLDEEYYDEQQPDQKKRRLTPEQVHLLEKSFEEENKLEPERKTQLAKKLGLQTRQVAVWFQNRRARWKNKQLEKDYDHLKSSFDVLKSDYDSVLKENEKLKAELMALVEKLRAEEVAVVEAISGGGAKTDHLSSGSVGSAIVDDGRQLMDSGDSYFMSGDYHTGCAAAPAVDGIGSEEDDGSDDGRNYFSDEIPVLVAVEEEEEEVAEQNGGEPWWVWS